MAEILEDLQAEKFEGESSDSEKQLRENLERLQADLAKSEAILQEVLLENKQWKQKLKHIDGIQEAVVSHLKTGREKWLKMADNWSFAMEIAQMPMLESASKEREIPVPPAKKVSEEKVPDSNNEVAEEEQQQEQRRCLTDVSRIRMGDLSTILEEKSGNTSKQAFVKIDGASKRVTFRKSGSDTENDSSLPAFGNLPSSTPMKIDLMAGLNLMPVSGSSSSLNMSENKVRMSRRHITLASISETPSTSGTPKKPMTKTTISSFVNIRRRIKTDNASPPDTPPGNPKKKPARPLNSNPPSSSTSSSSPESPQKSHKKRSGTKRKLERKPVDKSPVKKKSKGRKTSDDLVMIASPLLPRRRGKPTELKEKSLKTKMRKT